MQTQILETHVSDVFHNKTDILQHSTLFIITLLLHPLAKLLTNISHTILLIQSPVPTYSLKLLPRNV